MADQPDTLATVRAALDLAAKATPGPWYIRHTRDGESCFVIRDEATREDLLVTDTATHDVFANVEAVIALRNAAPAIADLCREVEALRAAMRTISGIRDSIIGAQAVNWSEHVYPLVAALDGAGFRGVDYETARANLGTLLERIATAESRIASIGAEIDRTLGEHAGGRISALEAARDRIATLEAELAQAIAAVRPDLAQFLKATEE